MQRKLRRVMAVGVALVCLSAAVTFAQQSTTTTQVKKFEVIAVEGNQLVVHLPEGTREITVPQNFRFTVNGQQLSVGELKPGMTGTATITTTTTVKPVTVTTVKNGVVHQVSGSHIILRTEEGFRSFMEGDIEKRGVKIMRDGRPVRLTELSSGDHLTAVIITEKPPQVLTERQVQATTTASRTPAATPTAGTAPARPAAASPAPAQTAAAAPAQLPKTATPLPLLLLIGGASLGTGLALTIRRRR